MDFAIGDLTGQERMALCSRLFALGRAIGHEWARDNSVRRIDTRDLRNWTRMLTDADDIGKAVDTIEELMSRELR